MSSAFFDQQDSRGNVPFVAAVQRQGRYCLACGDERHRIGDRSNRMTPHVSFQGTQMADSQFPRIGECKRMLSR